MFTKVIVTKVIVQQDLPLQVGESDTIHDFCFDLMWAKQEL